VLELLLIESLRAQVAVLTKRTENSAQRAEI
jgi:hypothetical protein